MGFASLTATEEKLCQLMVEFPPLSVREIAERMGVKRQSYYRYKQDVAEKLYLPDAHARTVTAYLLYHMLSGTLWEGVEETY